jgi:predicted nucleic acid-binding protein
MSCPPASTAHVVVTDANILINLVHVGRLDLLGKLLRYSFVVPEQVIAEVKDPLQSVVLAKALDEGLLTAEKLTQIAELELYAELLCMQSC